MCRVFKYSVCVDVRFLRISVRGDVQAVVGTFYYFTKVTEDTSDFNLSLMIETLSSEIEHLYQYNPWWNMDRILKTRVTAAACDQ